MRKPQIIILAVILVLAGLTGLYVYQQSTRKILANSAQVVVDPVIVSSRVSGYVLSVDTENGAAVAAGNVLVQLDPSNFRVALAEAEAVLAAMERGVPQGVAQSLLAERSLLPDQAQLDARLTLARQTEAAARAAVEELSTQTAASVLERRRREAGRAAPADIQAARNRELAVQAQLDLAKDKFETAVLFRAQTERDLEQLKLALQSLDRLTAAAVTEVLPAQIAAQAERVRQAELALMDTQIAAPISGQVAMLAVGPGVAVSEGQPLLAILPGGKDTFEILAYFDADQARYLQSGLLCEAVLPEVDGRSLQGRVEEVRPAPGQVSGDEAPAGPAQLEVRIVVDSPEPDFAARLVPGLQAEISLPVSR